MKAVSYTCHRSLLLLSMLKWSLVSVSCAQGKLSQASGQGSFVPRALSDAAKQFNRTAASLWYQRAGSVSIGHLYKGDAQISVHEVTFTGTSHVC